MKVFKFGGASVKDAEGVKNISKIIQRYDEQLVIVVSAMGKTTDALEKLVEAYYDQDNNLEQEAFDRVKDFHFTLISDLFQNGELIKKKINLLFDQLQQKLSNPPSLNYDFEYDQIVSWGELLSTTIVSQYLNDEEGVVNQWVDIRPLLRTDENYRDAGVDWNLSGEFMRKQFNFNTQKVYLTQGFIGSTPNNLSTTLGREGSDYSGAIIAFALNADSLSIWKDVPGVLNADPRWYPKAIKIDELSYWETIELSYYGAQVIHPKTLKPLQNKSIPLYVKSFVNPDGVGTVIRSDVKVKELPPVLVLKQNQIFITFSPKDFSFIMEKNLSQILTVFSKYRIKINLMQNSALNFSVCVDMKRNIPQLIEELNEQYLIRYNEDVELVTIRHYNESVIEEIIKGKEIVDSQISRVTARYVLKKCPWDFS